MGRSFVLIFLGGGGGFLLNSRGTIDFLSFFFIFLLLFLFYVGTLFLFVQHSLIYSHNFLCLWGKCKSWAVCFFVFGHRYSV